jgi:hypothetical protein
VSTLTAGAIVQGLTVGRGAGAVATNTAVGASALAANTTGDFGTAIGSEAGNKNTTGRFLVAVGRQAGYNNLTGGSNTAVGESAFFTNSAGDDNTAIGQAALYTNTASQNTAVGASALVLNSSGTANSALGYQALRSNTTASNNTAVGYQAGYTNQTGSGNTFLGYSAGYVSTGSHNTLLGRAAGLALTTGTSNTFVGGYDASTGGSGAEITSGSNNTILGAYNGNQGGLDIRTASNFIVLSDGDGNPLIATYPGASVSLNGAVPQTGTGITFPATQLASSNANTLDDYEEGTWTPTFGGSGSDPTGVSYSEQEGTYTKIGNRVFVEFFLSFTTFTGGSNAFYIRGLPFSGSGHGDGPMKIENVSLTAGKTYLVGTISASVIAPNQVGSNTTWNNLTVGTNVTSSATVKYFTGSLCYKI